MLFFHELKELERLKYFWRAVINKAISDIRSKSPDTEARQLKVDAYIWLENDKEDFDLVCEYSGMCKTLVRTKLVELAKARGVWRKTN